MFEKPALTNDGRNELLQKRGLVISNIPKAHKYLSHISYYRLGECWFVMQ